MTLIEIILAVYATVMAGFWFWARRHVEEWRDEARDHHKRGIAAMEAATASLKEAGEAEKLATRKLKEANARHAAVDYAVRRARGEVDDEEEVPPWLP